MLQRARPILSVMCVILPLAALALILQGQHADSAASTQLFVSKLPTPTPAATATPAVPGLFISPLSTPAGMTIQARLPLVHLHPTPTPTPTPPPIQYGWKGVGHTSEAAALGASNDPTNNFWGIDPDWWFDWSSSGVTRAADASAEELLSQMAVRLADPEFVPTIWCTSDTAGAVSPADIGTLAGQHRGRVWLMFNEPDNDGHSDSCGFYIKGNLDHSHYYTNQDWLGLGIYLADEYAKYATAILNADPTARIFTFATMQLPMPTLTVLNNPNDAYRQRALPIWQGFLSRMVSEHSEIPIDGIVIHAYPNSFSTYHIDTIPACQGVHGGMPTWFLDPQCVERAIEDAYRFFQGTENPQPGLTQNKPIWVTETGVLTQHTQLAWNSVKTGYQTPLMNWLTPRMAPAAQPCCAWINAVAWYSTHRPDHSASNLLVPTPVAPPVLGALTPLGVVWRDMSCLNCACPGYDCIISGDGQ